MEIKKNMKCKYCKSHEELKWPENYKKGDRPVNSETGAKHDCVEESDTAFLDMPAPLAIGQSILTGDLNQNMANPAQSVRGLVCDLCETPLIDCGCGNCSYLGAIYCPTCKVHPGGKKA